jgi:aminoglycoside phosphotransferase (APT) family kinase protein
MIASLATRRPRRNRPARHTREVTDDLKRLLLEHAGLDVAALAPAGGESHGTFWITGHDGTVSVLKIMPDADPGYLRALEAVLARLRDRGYPAPRILVTCNVPGLAFWVQERLPGVTPDLDTLTRLLPEIFRLNDAQAGLASQDGGRDDGRDGWPGELIRTLTEGGEGYCLHDTLLASPEARDLLPVLRRIGEESTIPPGRDFVHWDFHPVNLLSDGVSITGVIDINPPMLAGDRAFDLATLLFYCWDHAGLHAPLRERLLDLAGPEAARAYLAHMVLRQLEWSLRFHPGTADTQHYLELGRRVAADISAGQ